MNGRALRNWHSAFLLILGMDSLRSVGREVFSAPRPLTTCCTSSQVAFYLSILSARFELDDGCDT